MLTSLKLNHTYKLLYSTQTVGSSNKQNYAHNTEHLPSDLAIKRVCSGGEALVGGLARAERMDPTPLSSLALWQFSFNYKWMKQRLGRLLPEESVMELQDLFGTHTKLLWQ